MNHESGMSGDFSSLPKISFSHFQTPADTSGLQDVLEHPPQPDSKPTSQGLVDPCQARGADKPAANSSMPCARVRIEAASRNCQVPDPVQTNAPHALIELHYTLLIVTYTNVSIAYFSRAVRLQASNAPSSPDLRVQN